MFVRFIPITTDTKIKAKIRVTKIPTRILTRINTMINKINPQTTLRGPVSTLVYKGVMTSMAGVAPVVCNLTLTARVRARTVAARMVKTREVVLRWFQFQGIQGQFQGIQWIQWIQGI